MPRAKRFYIPGMIWHITHRCHKREFLLKFPRDRRRWLFWLRQSKERYETRILGYAVTSNHIHLLVQDDEKNKGTIAKTMHLTAGRTAQEYNFKKRRKGAFWEDRYHATAIESGQHFLNCLTYIDLNMVRTGVVQHPREWPHCGYHEVKNDEEVNGIVDMKSLMEAFGFHELNVMRRFYTKLIEEALRSDSRHREGIWTESVAVGSQGFVEQIRNRLGVRLRSRRIHEGDGVFMIREDPNSWAIDPI